MQSIRDAMVKAGLIPRETAARVGRALERQREIRKKWLLRARERNRTTPPDEIAAELTHHAANAAPQR